jgi:CRISPR/Cas system Type II protein with McrA/HNH and RuvC-like nuclease domain
MTPLLPTPKDYLYNLIAMTSPEAKRLWRRSIKEHFDHTCIYCGKTYDLSQLSIDHVHPRARGGEDVATNVVCACTRCNQDKGSTPVLSWMRDKFGVNRLREKLIMEYIN